MDELGRLIALSIAGVRVLKVEPEHRALVYGHRCPPAVRVEFTEAVRPETLTRESVRLAAWGLDENAARVPRRDLQGTVEPLAAPRGFATGVAFRPTGGFRAEHDSVTGRSFEGPIQYEFMIRGTGSRPVVGCDGAPLAGDPAQPGAQADFTSRFTIFWLDL